MKSMLIAAGAAGILALGAVAAEAQTPPPAGAPADQTQAGAARGGPGAGMRRGPGMRGPGMVRERPSLEQLQTRNGEIFAQMDANRDGRATLDEFRQFQERRRLERQQRMFQRFSGGRDSVTLDELNARTAERYAQWQNRGGPGRRGR